MSDFIVTLRDAEGNDIEWSNSTHRIERVEGYDGAEYFVFLIDDETPYEVASTLDAAIART